MLDKRYYLFASGCAIALASVSAPAFAADEPPAKGEEIVVTADRTSRPLQEVPIAASVINGRDIATQGRAKLDDILSNAPGIEVQGVSRGFVVNIRGLGLNLPPQNGAGAVSTMYDGAYSSRGEAASAGFYDLDRVEALRGPQSTIYGRNAVGGVVNVVSRDPALGRFEGYVQADVGNYSHMRGEGAVNVPLGNTIAIRVSAAGVSRDGFISNGRDDNKASSERVKLLFKPSDALTALFGFEQTLLGGKGPGALPIANYNAGNRITTDPSQGYQHHIARKYWAVLKADIGPGELFVEPSYQTLTGIVQGSFGGNFAYNYDPQYTNQFAVEARYGSKAGAPVQWDVGFYHYHNNQAGPTFVSGSCFSPGTGPGQGVVYIPQPGFSNLLPGPPGGPCATTAYKSEFTGDTRSTDANSVFGQITLPVMPTLRLVAGGRYSWVTINGTTDLNNNNNAGAFGAPVTTPDIRKLATVKEHFFDFRAGLEWNVAEHSLAYATVASGHREGGYGFPAPGSLPGGYAPESMVDYEIGLKNSFLGGRLIVNADAFYYDYKSYQLVLVSFAGGNFSANFDTFPAREYGGELDIDYAITPADHVNASVALLDSKLKCDAKNGCDYNGEQFTFAPKRTFKVGYSHDFDLGSAGRVSARADMRAVSSQLVTANDVAAMVNANDIQGAYATGDLFLTWTAANKQISVTGYLKNINDKLIKSSYFFGYAQVQAPRTFGATFNAKF